MGERITPSGVRIVDNFRDNLIIDRYHPDFAAMRGAKLNQMRSENSEDVLTWNVFRSLGQIDPGLWISRLRARMLDAEPTSPPHIVSIRLWTVLDPPPSLRLFQKDEGQSEVDLLIETEYSVWSIEIKHKSDVTKKTKNNPDRDQVLRNIDVGSWYAGVRDFYFALLITGENWTPRGVELLKHYQNDRKVLLAKLPHRPDGLANLKGLGILLWSDIAGVLRECATAAAREDERQIAARALAWLEIKTGMGQALDQ